MEQIYYWIGFFIFWMSAIIANTLLIGIFIDYLGRRFKPLWIIVEFVVYKKDFLEWVKDKKRHPRSQ